MIAGWFPAGQTEDKLLPGGRLRGPTPYVIAIMTFAMIIVAAAGLALSTTAGLVADAAANRHIVQIPDGDAARVAAAVAAARSSPGVTAVRPVPAAETRRTLERWLGPLGPANDLPIPALVNLDLAPGADSAALARRIAAAAPGARLVSEQATLGPLLGSLRALQWLALSLVLLMAAATSAAVILAARGALDTHRSTIEVMHGIGATDHQLARLFQRKIALDAITGSLAGTVAAALVLALLAAGGASFAGDLFGGRVLGPGAIAVLALLPLAAVALATVVARTAVLKALRQAP
ncbi:FtsX-like permease family protein [Sphingomonas sp.]|uniref:cell division protein FtsX n=1 Tax=Sphingomonas sp. TaxID=28214 RepID=UPI00286E0207|nr:cell division protein [Sphingomonas sp.]